jgi:hypothetical protein
MRFSTAHCHEIQETKFETKSKPVCSESAKIPRSKGILHSCRLVSLSCFFVALVNEYGATVE